MIANLINRPRVFCVRSVRWTKMYFVIPCTTSVVFATNISSLMSNSSAMGLPEIALIRCWRFRSMCFASGLRVA